MTDEQLWFIRNIVAPCLKALDESAASPTQPAGPAVALLIDGENCPPDLAGAALTEAAKHGRVLVRRVYANWAMASPRWMEPVARHNIRPIHHQPAVPRKNAIDIALVVDAMDLLHAGVVSCFCLVASDSDYTPLVTRLCEAGRTVVVFGKANTPQALVQACSLFVPLERLGAPPEPPAPEQPPAQPPAHHAAPPAPKPPPAPAPAADELEPPPNPAPLLLVAWKATNKAHGVSLSDLVIEIQQRYPDLRPETYGHTEISQLILQRSDLFTIHQDGTNPARQLVTLVASVARQLQQASGQTQAPGKTTAPAQGEATSSQGQVPAGDPPKVVSEAQRKRLRRLLLQAWERASKQDGWLLVGALGHQLKQLDPTFNPKTYGYSRLIPLLEDHADLFVLDSRDKGQNYVRRINT